MGGSRRPSSAAKGAESHALVRSGTHAPSQSFGPGASVYVSSFGYHIKHKPPKAQTRSSKLTCCRKAGSLRRSRGGYDVLEGNGGHGGDDTDDGDGDGGDKPVLSDVSLHLQPGGMLAILGNSGSGKTSLLDCVAQRTPKGSHTTGSMYMDGKPVTTAMFRAHGAYVMQDDTLLPFLTVRETLSYVLRLRLDCSREEHDHKIDTVIQALGLKAVENSVIGGTDARGISGGEKRRVSIGIQLLMEPSLLLLDEPTSGLDSNSANHLVVLLSQLAATKRHTIMLTIHQPRSDMFQVFQQVMILSAGHMTYCGPAQSMVEYFTRLGYPCPPYTNPLDEYVDICSVDTRRTGTIRMTRARVCELAAAFKKSDIAKSIPDSCPDLNEADDDNATAMSPGKNRSPLWLKKTVTLASRMNVNLLRARPQLKMRVSQAFMYAFTLFLFILRLDKSQRSIQDRSGILYQSVSAPLFLSMINAVALFPPLRSCMGREVRDGLYRTPVFMLGYLLHMLPFCIVSSVLFATTLYWAVGFNAEPGPFFGFVAVAICVQFIGEAVGLVWLSVFQNPNVANSVSALWFSLTSILCSGFLRNIQAMPQGLQDFAHIGVQRYVGEIVAANEFRDMRFDCAPANDTGAQPCRYPTGAAYLAANFPTAARDLGQNYLITVGYCVLVYAIATLCFSLKSNARRR